MCEQSLYEKMRVSGVPYQKLLVEFMGDGELLANTLNGLSLLELGYAQPDMGPDDYSDKVVWDGAFTWDAANRIMTFDGASGPGGPPGVVPRSFTVYDDTLIQVFGI